MARGHFHGTEARIRTYGPEEIKSCMAKSRRKGDHRRAADLDSRPDRYGHVGNVIMKTISMTLTRLAALALLTGTVGADAQERRGGFTGRDVPVLAPLLGDFVNRTSARPRSNGHWPLARRAEGDRGKGLYALVWTEKRLSRPPGRTSGSWPPNSKGPHRALACT